MDILAVQQRFLDAGYQYREHVFNDSNDRNCVIRFTCSRDPHYLRNHPASDFGWGRFQRMDAWRQAAEWLDAVEAGEKKPCLPMSEPVTA